MVLPLVPMLMLGSSLFAGGTGIWNLLQSRQMTQRSEQFSRLQSSDLDKRLSDYRRNTGLEPAYKYSGLSGQAEYLRNVQIPNYSNMYSMNTASMWGTGARTAFSAGFAYNHYRNNMGYRPSQSKPGTYDPSYG